MILSDTAPKELINKLESKGWHRHGIYRTVLIWAAELLPGLSKESFALEGIGKGMENAIEIGGEFFVVQKEFDEFCKLYDEKLKNGIPYLKDYIEHYQKDMDAALADSKRIGEADHSRLTNKELGELFLEHLKCIWPLHHWLWSMEFLNESFDKKVHELMVRAYPDWNSIDTDTFLGNASYTFKRQFFQKEQEEIVALDSVEDPRLMDIFAKYNWLKMYFIDERPFSISEYKERAKEILNDKEKALGQIKKSLDDAEKAKRLVEGVKDEELRQYLLLMQELSHLKTYRIDVYTLTFHYVLPMRNEIMKRLGLSFERFILHTKAEIVEALNGNPLPESEINMRNTWVVVMSENRMEFLKGDAAVKQVRDAIWKEGNRPDSIKGTIAYPGVVRGPVRISFSSKDIYKVEQGDILVCNLTNPDYNSIFKKLSGIITDEGGVLCHSAIMAREFKIPCIIGTKIATKVLKDGDMVEVDANKGIVSILENK